MTSTITWDQPLIAVDVIPYTLDPITRKLGVVVSKRKHAPNTGDFALPGVLLLANERAHVAAERAIKTKINEDINITFIRDIGVADNPDRDIRGPSLSVLFLAVVENIVETDDVKVVPIEDTAAYAFPFDHNNLIARATKVINSYVLADKEATKALVGESFRTTDMFTVLDSLHKVTGDGLAPDPSNLSRRLKGTEWVSKVDQTEALALTSSSKGRPSTYWSFD